MKASRARSRKRKSAALESTDEAPAPPAAVALVAAVPLPGAAAEDERGVGEEGGGADRLSSLPDDVLGDIISLLSTKEGARTRILAPRWRDLWLSAPLNLDCRELRAADRSSFRADVVSRILSSHHGPCRRLYVDTYCFFVPLDYDTLEALLRSAALDNLEELDVIGRNRLEQPHGALIFRFSRTLRVANITECNLSDVSFQGLHFPVLKQLGLVSVTISQLSLDTLITGCSSLEYLMIKGYSVGFCCIRINSLSIRAIGMFAQQKQLVIENAPCLLRLLLRDPQNRLHVSVGAAPKLETLGFIGDRCDPSEFSTLVFGSTVIQGLLVDKLITEVHTVKLLALDMCNLCLDTVIELIRCFPCLEKLYITSYRSRPRNCWRRKHRNLIELLDLRLKKVVLKRYQGTKSQVNFVTFFVLNANLLESVTLGIYGRNNNEEFFAEQRVKLQIENRVSRDARLQFTTGECVRSFSGNMRDLDLDVTDPFIPM